MMASSKFMATTSTTNADLPRQQQPSISSSLSSILADFQNQDQSPGEPSANLGSMNMDDLITNMYATPTPDQVALGGATIAREVNDAGAAIDNSNNNRLSKSSSSNDHRSVDDVWKQIVAGGGSDQRRAGAGVDVEMTLEAFLTKAGAVREEDVRAYGNNNPSHHNNVNTNGTVNDNCNKNNNHTVVVGPGGGGGGRVKRRVVEEPPMDKATQQKQRRMIKNRESAARSRERKQAYTVELVSLVTQLEEENARLIREEAEHNKQRFKQLMENLIPVVEKRRPPRVLRRVHSLHW